MKTPNTMDVAGNTRNGTNGHNGHVTLKATRRHVEAATGQGEVEDVDGGEDTSGLRKRFVSALTANQKTLGTLADVVREMIDSEVEREEAIDWGIEAGLSESYVRSTVSRLYSDLVGRERAKGAGRKGNKGAAEVAEYALRAVKGDFAKAKAVLLAARRHVEKLEAAEAKAAKE